MNTCQIQQTTKTLKFVPANNTSLKVYPGLMKVGSVIRCLYTTFHRHRKLIVISLHKIVDPENIKGDFEGMCVYVCVYVCVCVWGGGGGGGDRTPIYMLAR